MISSSIARIRSCSSQDVLGRAEREHLHLVELVDAEHPAEVLPVGTGLPSEAARVPRVPDRQVGFLDDLAEVERGQRHLGRPDEIELVLAGHVEVHGLRREEPGAVHRVLPDEDRRDHRREALLDDDVHRVAHQRELHEDEVTHQVDEPGARRPCSALGVEDPEHRPELRVVSWLEVEHRRLRRGCV